MLTTQDIQLFPFIECSIVKVKVDNKLASLKRTQMTRSASCFKFADLHSKFNDFICNQFLSTDIKLLKKIYQNFSSILHVRTGFLQHFEINIFF